MRNQMAISQDQRSAIIDRLLGVILRLKRHDVDLRSEVVQRATLTLSGFGT